MADFMSDFQPAEKNDLVVCQHLSHFFGKVQALDAVTLTLSRGKIIGMLGPNGSGKTTLIKLLNGLLTPSAGTILIDGEAVGEKTHGIVSYLPERISIPLWMKVSQLLSFYEDFYPDFQREVAERMLENLHIPLEQTIKAQSKGTREKVQLIMVMSRKAQLYLLDEPIGGVDPAARDYILNTIISNYNPNASVIISTHLIADVEQILDEVLFLRYGELIVQASVDDIREREGKSVDAQFREVFKC